MIRLFLTIILVLTFHHSFSQDIIGNWYMVNRSGLIEFSISSDSIKTRKLFADFKPKGKLGEAKAIIKMVKLSDRILIICKHEDDTLKFSAATFINLIDKKYVQLAWNVPDTAMNNIESLIQYHRNDQRKLFGYYAFSEHYMNSLKQMKPIEDLSLADFKKYLKTYFDKIGLTEIEAEKYNTAYLSYFTYNFQLMSQSLFDIGFNPLQSPQTLDSVYMKFSKHAEVKKMLEKAKRN